MGDSMFFFRLLRRELTKRQPHELVRLKNTECIHTVAADLLAG